jgi:hypothetical protein
MVAEVHGERSRLRAHAAPERDRTSLLVEAGWRVPEAL